MRRFVLVFTLLLSIISSITGDETDPHPVVNPPAGRVRGSILKSRAGKDIYTFRGIRFAEPPVGERRFALPIPVNDSLDVIDATEEGPSCPQWKGYLMSEDCLRLNIYSTSLPSQRRSRRDVLVFFHPGNFYALSGQSIIFGPEYLMDHEIVLVTVNYRLGSLGFISTGDALAPGNLGLKDQVVALQWVRRNIAAFGGNPRSVTIAGNNAGAWSVILHMLSPLSRNLFHRAIAMSGAPTIDSLLPTHQKHLAIKQAQLLNCPIDSTHNMLACLRTKPVEEFTATMPLFAEWYGDPVFIWTPVIEPEIVGEGRFLTGQPIDLIREREMHHVPLMCGITKDEFGGVVVSLVEQLQQGNDSIVRDLNENWEKLAPINFLYERDTPRSRYISQELRKFYFRDQPISMQNIKGLAHLYADALIIHPTYRTIKLMTEYSRDPVYVYKFTFEGTESFVKWNNGSKYGVEHDDELQYLFHLGWLPLFEPDTLDVPMVEILTRLWSNFVMHGRPSRGEDVIEWRRHSLRRDNYLEINAQPVMKNGIFPERMQMWEKLFPLPILPGDRED